MRVAKKMTAAALGAPYYTRSHVSAVELAKMGASLHALYPLNAHVTPRSVAEYEILRRATGTHATPGLLHIASGQVVVPRVRSDIADFLRAEAAEYTRLWKQYGGPPDDYPV